MKLTHLKVNQLRNLSPLSIEPGASFNLIYGQNGSGKTSILEAIYFLSLGRSFRTNLATHLIHYQAETLTVWGVAEDEDGISIATGIEKKRQGKTRIKMGNEMSASVADLARSLPLQLINPDSYRLLNEGPRQRREFLDWGLFHVEHSFFPLWQRFQRVLKQRNASLQQNLSSNQVKAWDGELVNVAKEISALRREFIKKLTPVVFSVLKDLIHLEDLTLTYYQGWSEEKGLDAILDQNFQRDSSLRYTQYGPQRADLRIKINQHPVQDILSRGEQKLLVIALRLAQGILLRQITAKKCLYLLDDLAAELDPERRQCIMRVLSDLEAQVFITAVELDPLQAIAEDKKAKMFHVEHGVVEG